MFTLEQIAAAHNKVESGADFPRYIQEIKALGVTGFTTWVVDSHTTYHGADGYAISSTPAYPALEVADTSNKTLFQEKLQLHQQGGTDYITFCNDCAETGIEKWIVDLDALTCIYYDKAGVQILEEKIPV